MNFYEKFKADVDVAVKPLYDTVSNLQKQLGDIGKRLAEEKKQSESLEQRIAALKELSTDALTSSRNRYDKFKNSMRKLSAQLSQSQETVHIFEDELIPKKRQELAGARQKAGAAIYLFWVNKRPLVEKLLTELIDNIVTEYDGFLNSVSLSVQDYFQGDVTGHKSPFSGTMNSDNMGVWPALCHPRINARSWRINNKPPAEIAAKPVVNPRITPEPPAPPEIAPAEAQDTPEAVEGECYAQGRDRKLQRLNCPLAIHLGQRLSLL
jgi:hypothetical protein